MAWIARVRSPTGPVSKKHYDTCQSVKRNFQPQNQRDISILIIILIVFVVYHMFIIFSLVRWTRGITIMERIFLDNWEKNEVTQLRELLPNMPDWIKNYYKR